MGCFRKMCLIAAMIPVMQFGVISEASCENPPQVCGNLTKSVLKCCKECLNWGSMSVVGSVAINIWDNSYGDKNNLSYFFNFMKGDCYLNWIGALLSAAGCVFHVSSIATRYISPFLEKISRVVLIDVGGGWRTVCDVLGLINCAYSVLDFYDEKPFYFFRVPRSPSSPSNPSNPSSPSNPSNPSNPSSLSSLSPSGGIEGWLTASERALRRIAWLCSIFSVGYYLGDRPSLNGAIQEVIKRTARQSRK